MISIQKGKDEEVAKENEFVRESIQRLKISEQKAKH